MICFKSLKPLFGDRGGCLPPFLLMILFLVPMALRAAVFEEVNGLVAVEAEHFVSQSSGEPREWYLTSETVTPDVSPDPDGPHTSGASGSAYIEILPDTRVTHDDPLVSGVSFNNVPDDLGKIDYQIYFNTTGRYYVWARIYSSGAEDNGLHVGINGTWPASGQRMQWCAGKNSWYWNSAQRTNANHCGEEDKIFIDVNEPGLHTISFAMREDGVEFDKFIMTQDINYSRPSGAGPAEKIYSGAVSSSGVSSSPSSSSSAGGVSMTIPAVDFAPGDFYVDNNTMGPWLGINPSNHQEATASYTFGGSAGTYDVQLNAVGEHDGRPWYEFFVNDQKVGEFRASRVGNDTYEEGADFRTTFHDIEIPAGASLKVWAHVDSLLIDGSVEYARARWESLVLTSAGAISSSSVSSSSSQPPVTEDGVTLAGERKRWHEVSLTFTGPQASEEGTPNPFADYKLEVTFSNGNTSYTVPGHFAADGNAAESSAQSGNKWRVYFAPDKIGTWSWTASMVQGTDVAIDDGASGTAVSSVDGKTGSFVVTEEDKPYDDFRHKGRLAYVGEHHLKHLGNDEFFIKTGADSPENFLAYEDFDDVPNRGNRRKSWNPHSSDYDATTQAAYTWKNGKGSEMLGALRYLRNTGMNAFSFLTFSLAGDDENVFPHLLKVGMSTYNSYGDADQWNKGVHQDRFDVSRMDQWNKIFGYADQAGLYLHFKLQETENEERMDGGATGRERKLYLRELISRYAHHLALNWNLGEENNDMSDQERKDMAAYVRDTDPYGHHIVIHSYPSEISKIYTPLLGNASALTGVSIQTGKSNVHPETVKWVEESAAAGKKWVVANDEQNGANAGVTADASYSGDKGSQSDNVDDVRKQVLWGNFMGGGAGVEYYFGYQTGETDLSAEDWRSRKTKWEQANVAKSFFKEHVPFWQMSPQDNLSDGNYVLREVGKHYLVYAPEGGAVSLDLAEASGNSFDVYWYNPRTGGELQQTSLKRVNGGGTVDLGEAPSESGNDWAVFLREVNEEPVGLADNQGLQLNRPDMQHALIRRTLVAGQFMLLPGDMEWSVRIFAVDGRSVLQTSQKGGTVFSLPSTFNPGVYLMIARPMNP